MTSPALRLVVPRFGSQIVGGSEGLARRLAGALSHRGWRVSVWSTTAEDEATWGGQLPTAETIDGYEVRRFPVVTRRRPRSFHQASRVFYRLPLRLRPEALWLRLQGPYSPALVRALAAADGTPTLFTPYLYFPTVCGLPAAPHPRLLIPAAHDEAPLQLAAVRRTLVAADAILYGTPEERELVECAHPVAKDKRSALGTVGVDDRGPGDPERFRARFGIRGRFFFYGGRATAGKGTDVLLEGFDLARRQRTEAQLVIAGPAITSDQRAGVHAVGALADDDWRDALAASHAVIIPSRMESLSLLALDAWVAGRPCVVNAESAVLRGQITRSGGGVIFDGARGLAARLTSLLDTPELADRLGSSGREYAQLNYRWDDVAARIQGLIDAGVH